MSGDNQVIASTDEEQDQVPTIQAALPEELAMASSRGIDAAGGGSPSIAPVSQQAPVAHAITDNQTPAIEVSKGSSNERVPPGYGQGSPSGSQDASNSKSIEPMEQRVNPFAGVFAKTDNIHNPFLRVLAKLGSGVATLGTGALQGRFPEQAEQRQKMLQSDDEAGFKRQDEARQDTLAKSEVDKNEIGKYIPGVDPATGDNVYYKAEGGKLIPTGVRAPATVGKTGEEIALHDLMTGGSGGTPRINPSTNKPYSYLEAYTAAKQAADVKPGDTPVDQGTAENHNKQVDLLFPNEPDKAKLFYAAPGMTSSSVEKRLADAHSTATEIGTRDREDPIAKLETPEALASPGAAAAIQAKAADPRTSPQDKARLQLLLPKAAVAQQQVESTKLREKLAEQTAVQGNALNAGQLLLSHALTLPELKSRQVTPQFIAQAVNAAQQGNKDPKKGPVFAGDPNFKAAEAEGQAKVAGSEANTVFFGNVDSLVTKGGTLDQMAGAIAGLPSTGLPALNSLVNLKLAMAGEPQVARYAATVLGIADDYSKVMTGGAGSDTSRQYVVDLYDKAQSQKQKDAVTAQIRQQVLSQRRGRQGVNPYLKDMYPEPKGIEGGTPEFNWSQHPRAQ